MERLIYSNPTPSSKILLKHHHVPFLPPPSSLRLTSTNSAVSPSKNFNTFFPPSPRLLQWPRVKPLSCCSSSPSNYPNYASKDKEDSGSDDFTSFSSADSRHGSVEKTPILGKFVEALAGQRTKVVAAGTVVLLSVILITVIHPLAVLPAFASFVGATNTGGPAVAAGSQVLRSELLNSAWTGFLAGCLHTLSGPDHLAALAPLSIGRTRIESAVVGALWGCGHDAGQVIFGLIFLLLKDRLHIEIIRTWGTRVVGLTLMVIGAMGIKEASEVPTPCVALENGECDVSVYEAGLEKPTTIGKKKIGFATFATGIVHGLQPDALIVILPALALPSRLAGAAFLFMFLVGTVIAMGSYTVLIGSCSQALKERIPRITEKLTWGSSLIAIALGFAIVISQFFGFSLY
ncbi:OLC1v1003563C1 [Oldenlandia corymbosa var. corymbosa]|uniref:OLC1v1003563C1 n=1 Tax=Oldenlandia corymbosa var. corymbosa TaxID=529605 RepID=A0AAV1DAA3_OLDCO|nr:OLC1v1003563C1 [Oldenlandia corymbosa var. corymbosa]